jgi:hypothetical protein
VKSDSCATADGLHNDPGPGIRRRPNRAESGPGDFSR